MENQNNVIESEKWYHGIDYDSIKVIISDNLKSMSRSFIAIGYYLKYIRDKKLYQEDGYESVWDFASDQYGISTSTASRWMSMNDKFSKDGNSPILAEEYKQFGKSQLQEMLYLTDEQMEQAKPEMAAKEIRALRKPDVLEEVQESEAEEEQIPGQMDVGDYPEYLPEESEIEPETVALAQQIPEIPEGEEIVLDEVEDSGDNLFLIRQMLDKENRELEEYIKVNEVDPLPERMLEEKKIIVAALAGMLCDLKLREDIQEPVQPPLPILKNNDQRKEWLRSYKDWGLWYEDEHIGATYYKYDFENGVRLIVEVFVEPADEWRDEYESSTLHLVGGPEPERDKTYGISKWPYHNRYHRYPDSETQLVEFLKYIQKKEK